nr:hypothetical protein [Tanacetum cinerariifolium]
CLATSIPLKDNSQGRDSDIGQAYLDSSDALEKVKVLEANGDMSGSRVRVVWMELGGGVVRARVVFRVVVKVVLIGFSVEELALDAMEYDDQRMEYEEGCLQIL